MFHQPIDSKVCFHKVTEVGHVSLAILTVFMSLRLCVPIEPRKLSPGGGGGQGGGVRSKPCDRCQESVGGFGNTGVLRPTQRVPAVRLHQIVSIRHTTEIVLSSALPDFHNIVSIDITQLRLYSVV